MSYEAICKPNQLIYGTGEDTVIVAGWTPRKAIAKKLGDDKYAAIGQLYSPSRGINFLLRNLLANPQIKRVIGVNATREDANAKAVQCLRDFFARGFVLHVADGEKKQWKVNSQVPGFIDFEIEQQALAQLILGVQYIEVWSIEQLLAETAEPASALFWSREKQIFPTAAVKTDTYPGGRYGHRIEGRTIAETWVKIIHLIKTTGTIRPTGYDGKWQELINLMAVVTEEPEDFYFPDPNFLPIDRDYLEGYIGQVLDDSPYIEGVKYTYGQRLRSWFGVDQIEQILKKLTDEIDAASAVMSLWDVQDHVKGGSPCLNHIWIRIVEEEISLTAIFRSNDMFSAWVANAMGLRALQYHIKDELMRRTPGLELTTGPLITISQSAHIYDDCWENADALIKQQHKQILRRRQFDDPCGNFVIETEGNTIVVTRTTSGSGEAIATYTGINPLKLLREIVADAPALQPDHAGYLGIELEKAKQRIAE